MAGRFISNVEENECEWNALKHTCCLPNSLSLAANILFYAVLAISNVLVMWLIIVASKIVPTLHKKNSSPWPKICLHSLFRWKNRLKMCPNPMKGLLSGGQILGLGRGTFLEFAPPPWQKALAAVPVYRCQQEFNCGVTELKFAHYDDRIKEKKSTYS